MLNQCGAFLDSYDKQIMKLKKKFKKNAVIAFSAGILTLGFWGGHPSGILAQGEGEPSFGFLFAGYSLKWRANETFIISTQEELDRLMHELEAPEYTKYLPDLLPEPGRPDFNPVVDFSQEIVVVVVGERHDNPCRKTKVTGVQRVRANDLKVDLEEIFLTSCKITASAPSAPPVILLKVKQPVAGVKVFSTIKELGGE